VPNIGIHFIGDALPDGVILDVPSYAACCELCWQREQCGAYVYYVNVTDKECTLKLPSGFFRIPDSRPNHLLISGQLVAPRQPQGKHKFTVCSTLNCLQAILNE